MITVPCVLAFRAGQCRHLRGAVARVPPVHKMALGVARGAKPFTLPVAPVDSGHWTGTMHRPATMTRFHSRFGRVLQKATRLIPVNLTYCFLGSILIYARKSCASLATRLVQKALAAKPPDSAAQLQPEPHSFGFFSAARAVLRPSCPKYTSRRLGASSQRNCPGWIR
jgi:hypothetical protein